MASSNEENDPIGRIEKFVSTIAVQEGFKHFKLKTTKKSTDGANYMGDLFYVDVYEDGKDTLKLFVKASNTPEHVRDKVPANEVYKHEVFVYTTLADTYNDLQERHGVPEEKRFKFPKYYGSNLKDMEEMLVLENLVEQGFTLHDRFKPIDWEFAKAAVTEIAKFHALSFALKTENPDIFERITKQLPNFYSGDSMKHILDTMKKLLPVTVGCVEPENRRRLQKYIDKHIDRFLVHHFEPTKHSIVIHADYHVSNILVKYQNNKVVSLKPVDYQTLLYGDPLNDIVYLLFVGSDEDFRKKHFEEYLEHYYSSLAEQLKLLSQDINYIYPKSAFYFDLKDKLRYGLEVALFVLNAVLVEPKKVINVETLLSPDMNAKTTESMKPSELYAERLNGIVRDFVRWGYFDEFEDITTAVSEGEKANTNRGIETLISTIAEKEGYKNFKLETKAISTQGANYMGDLYYVDVIEDGKETLNLFVKVANTPEHVRKVMPTNDVYKNEVFVYTTLSDTFNDLQERHGVPEEKRFKFAKYYGSNLKEMEEMMVFENLAAQGFILYDRFKPIDWEYAKAGVEEIAKFHAMSFALQKENPDGFKELSKHLMKMTDNDAIMNNFIETAKKGIPLALSIIEPENQSKLQKYIDGMEDTFMYNYYLCNSKYSSLIHSDFRASNIMVKYQGYDVVSLIPVDYQSVFYGCPINDILYFLFTGSDESFRRQHFDQYFERYHNSLAQHLKLLSHDINDVYPKSAFYFELKDKLRFGLEIALITLNIVLVDVNNVTTIGDIINPDAPSPEANFSKLYVERLNGIVRDFARWGYFDENDKVEVKTSATDSNLNKEHPKTQTNSTSPSTKAREKDSSCCAIL